MILLHVLASMSEDMGPEVLQNVIQVCTFLQVMLDSMDIEKVTLALGILSSLLEGRKVMTHL